jgi:peptide/nickel transport system permease protein
MQSVVSLHPRQRIMRKLWSNPRFIVGIVVLGLTLFAAIGAPWLAPHPLGESELINRLCPPNAQHWLGCDMEGQDILTVMLYGSRISLYVAALTVALSLSLGTLLGLLSGYWRGWFDLVTMRIVDIFMAFPGILLALTLTAIIGPSLYTVVFAIAASGWTSTARLVRGQVLSVREREFVQASRALGASSQRLIFKHILPAILSPLVVHATFSLSSVIIVEAGLSFLGFGARDSVLTWGGLLGQASQVEMSQAPHLAVIPGLAIFVLVMALNLMGDALRDALDPRS